MPSFTLEVSWTWVWVLDWLLSSCASPSIKSQNAFKSQVFLLSKLVTLRCPFYFPYLRKNKQQNNTGVQGLHSHRPFPRLRRESAPEDTFYLCGILHTCYTTCAENAPTDTGGKNGCVYWTLFPQLFLLFHNKIKRKDVTILEFSVHALMTVYLECPSAMVLVPPGELLYHWEAVMGHTTLPEMKLLWALSSLSL